MVKVSILYPNTQGSHFDMAYYLQTHMPMAIKLLGTHPGYRGVSVEQGIGGAGPGAAAVFVAMCHFQFDSVESFMSAFSPHSAALRDDIPNYTNVEATIQFNEVLLTHSN